MSFIYTGARAAQLAWLSNLVYADWVTIYETLERNGFYLEDMYNNQDTQGMLVYGPGVEWAATVIRGTETGRMVSRDIASNFGSPVAWEGPGKVHSGYHHALGMIIEPALAMAEKVSSEVPLYVTGHSMGGSLATAFAAWYAHRYPHYNLAGLVTFGAPKAVDHVAADAIRARVYRYIMPGDFAPSWPLSRSLVHPGKRGPIRLRAENWWPGPVTRHSAAGYAGASY